MCLPVCLPAYHIVVGQFSVARLEKRYRIELLLLFGLLGALTLFVAMEVLRLYLGPLGLLLAVLAYDGLLMPAGLVWMGWTFYQTWAALSGE